MDKFRVEHKDFEGLMEEWFFEEERPVKEGERYILVMYLKGPYKLLDMMICKLYDEKTSAHFRMEWFLMDYIVVKTGQDFNWANILAFNIINQAW